LPVYGDGITTLNLTTVVNKYCSPTVVWLPRYLCNSAYKILATTRYGLHKYTVQAYSRHCIVDVQSPQTTKGEEPDNLVP
jgi:hypothetical protein